MFVTGSRFKVKYESNILKNEKFNTYILAQVEVKRINLIALESGNRFTNAIKVQNSMFVSKEEFMKLIPSFYTVKYYDRRQKKYKLIQQGRP